MRKKVSDFLAKLIAPGVGKGIMLVNGIVFTAIMTAVFVFQPFFLGLVEFKVYDALFRATYPGITSGKVVVVDLDEESLADFGQWPWPRYRMALLLEKIQRSGAASVGLDIVFAEEDRTSPRVIREHFEKEMGIAIHFSGLPRELEDNDALLAAVLERGPFVLGYYLEMSRRTREPRNDLAPGPGSRPLQFAVIHEAGAMPLDRALFRASEKTENIPVLSLAAPGAGFMNVAPDSDGIIRRVPLVMQYKGELYPSLGLAVLSEAMGSRQVIVRMTTGGVESLSLGNVVVPLDARGQLLLNFRGPSRTIDYISAGDILNDAFEPRSLEGKIVFLGSSATGLKDIRATPLDQVYPGVEAQATVVDNILKGDFIHRPDWAIGFELTLVVAMGIVSTILIVLLGGAWFVIPLVLCAGGLWFGSLHFMGSEGIYISPFMPLLTLVGNFGILTFQKFWIAEGEKRKIKNTFERYLSPQVIKRVTKNPDFLKLGGEKKNLSILFMDIRNFTTIAESMDPQDLVRFMNEFLTVMTDVILKNGGTLDKFMGDAIMAFFGAPEEMPEHARAANLTAIEMIERLHEYRERWDLQGVAGIQAGIGISSGDVIVGNMGSEHRFSYTVMGDPVNLASRLEGLTKLYGVNILISQYTRNQAGAETGCREIDWVRVKGKSKPVVIYEPFGKDATPLLRSGFIEVFEQGLAAYRSQDWAGATSCFEKCLEMKPIDKPSLMYIERCRKMAASPPGSDWDGVLLMAR